MSNFLDQWKYRLAELEKDLSVKREEIAEAFEKQKEHFAQLTDKVNNDLKDTFKDNPERTEELQRKLDELKVQFALGKAETRDKFEEQKKKMEQSLHSFHQQYEKVKTETQDKNLQFAESMSGFKELIQQKLDIFNLHFHLGKAEAAEEWEEQKKEINKQLHSMKEKIAEKTEEGESKFEQLGQELSEAYGHLQKGIKSLFS